jgi:hypothetical protein
MTLQEQHLEALIQKLQKENEIICKIATSSGFYQYYFEQLKFHKTNVECFETINDLYFKYFGEYKYSSYNSFRTLRNKNIKK